MSRIRCIIIDDEKEARLGLQSILLEVEDIEIISVCKNGLKAIEQINEFRPDLILLDIQMPGVNGFEVLASIEEPKPAVIFITAYDQYALKAFEVHALDYLLKPFTDERLFESLENARKNIQQSKNQITALLDQRSYPTKDEVVSLDDKSKLVFKSDGKVHFLDFNKIHWIEAYDYYVKVHVEKQFHLLREAMKRLEQRLPNFFIRVHKSAIVNTKSVQTMEHLPNSELELTLVSGQKVKVSRTRKKEVLNHF